MKKAKIKKPSKLIKLNNNPKQAEQNKFHFEKFYFFLIVVFLVYILDRYTKFLSSFVSGCFFFCVRQSFNYGAAFNLLQGFSWTRSLLIVVALVVLILAAYFYFSLPYSNLLHLGLVLLFGGTLCNMIDRFFFGYVIDWLTFSFLPVPSFNLADISNMAGIILLIIFLLRKK